MSTIEQDLQAIMNARYGRDVRQSIHDAISDINDIAQGAHDSAESYADEALENARRANQSANNSDTRATTSQSWAVGGTGTREGEDTNNAKYWAEQAQQGATGNGHTIVDSNGNIMPARGKMKFENSAVIDNGEDGETIIAPNMSVVLELPEYSDEYENCVYLYLGESDEFYTKGHFYKAHSHRPSPGGSWQEENIFTVSDILSVMPTANASYYGMHVLFVGTTTASYTQGSIYKCIYSSNAYSWQFVLDLTSGGSGTTDYTDLTNKPSVNNVTLTGNKTASDLGLVSSASVGVNGGVAGLDASGKVPSSQLPSFVDDVVEGYYDTTTDRFYEESTFETLITPVEGKSWVDVSANKSYRWTGSVYVRVDEGVQIGETSDTAYAGNKGKQNADNISAIQEIIPSNASTSNKLATMSDVGGGGGHVIEDESGTTMTQRGTMQFVGAEVTDDSTNQKTIVKTVKVVEVTMAQYLANKATYDASGDIIKITDSGQTNTAGNTSFDDTTAQIGANNVQTAIEKVSSNLTGLGISTLECGKSSTPAGGTATILFVNTHATAPKSVVATPTGSLSAVRVPIIGSVYNTGFEIATRDDAWALISSEFYWIAIW